MFGLQQVYPAKMLAGMPMEALPQGPRKGKLSYTIKSAATQAKVEVLLKGKAFRIVQTGSLQGFLPQICMFSSGKVFIHDSNVNIFGLGF